MNDATEQPPLVVEATRGLLVESRHLVDAAVLDASGGVAQAHGAIDAPVYPRSACKPLQALPLVESGAADAFGLSPKELALACASHNGEPVHVEGVLAWLGRLGLSDDDLECGAHLPRQEPVLAEFVRSGAKLRQAHNNCSGKHAGMLATAVHLGEPTKGYIGREHPVQRRVAAAMGELCDCRLDDFGIDGCGIPTFALPLRNLALGMARLADRPAGRRIVDAMIAEPYMVAGRGRACTELMQAGKGAVALKTGAEGVYMATLPERGLGLALKARDGAGRAAEMALAKLLAKLGALPEELAHRPLRNVRGLTIGELRAAAF
jgi:L-asparaginase II